jgi:DNA-binding HxlR family transcriptional regulator
MAARRSAAARTEQPPSTRPSARGVTSPTRAANLDRLVHDRTRLAIVSALAVNHTLSFNELKALTETTDGNLSVHARKLEEAGYITCTKGFEGRVPRTEFSLTEAGRRALQKYLDHMEAIIKHARSKSR